MCNIACRAPRNSNTRGNQVVVAVSIITSPVRHSDVGSSHPGDVPVAKGPAVRRVTGHRELSSVRGDP